jgi:transposase
MRHGSNKQQDAVVERRHVIGLDVSDRKANFVELDGDPAVEAVLAEGVVPLTEAGLRKRFGETERYVIALEVGPHSPWVSRLLERLGHEVVLANSREVALIHRSRRKSDRVDAETLARLARVDRTLLHPTRHRSEAAQADLAQTRARDALVRARTSLINSVRGQAKASGLRLPPCSSERFHQMQLELTGVLRSALLPLMESIAELTRQIRHYDRTIARLARECYPETQGPSQVQGVGALTALSFVLTLEDPKRFRKSRDVGAYLGLTPRRDQSGERDLQLGISKAGDPHLRRLLIQSAHYILGPFAEDSDLRRWGLGLAGEGNGRRKKKAVTAVARKLAVLLHHLWLTGAVYEPLHRAGRKHGSAAA